MSGDVDLAKDSDIGLMRQNTLTWQTALNLIRDEEMPPADAEQPSKGDRELIAKFLDQTLNSLDCETDKDPGPSVIRRLNRPQYDNSILSLTTLDLRLAESFPADASSYGFDNISASLTLSPLQVEQYYAAAKTVVSEILKSKDSPSPQAYQLVLAGAKPDRDSAREIMSRFAYRAFRRPVKDAWIDRLMQIYDRSLDQKVSHDDAVGNMLSAVLISPRFLMRAEATKPDQDDAFAIDNFDLASRLSFFLWSGPPDDELLQLAISNRLSGKKVLSEQVHRMLIDPRSDALIDQFFASWLQITGLPSRRPDAESFPAYSDELHQAIVEEPKRLLAEIVRKNRSITELIDARYTYVNEDLAKHYQLDGITGETMQRVSLKDRRRGGLLTSAALLMAQADPGRTNVPRRGNFVATTFLGTPSPPPPPDVPELEDAANADKPMTLRQRLEQHRSNAQCATCHSKIDPLGFGLKLRRDGSMARSRNRASDRRVRGFT